MDAFKKEWCGRGKDCYKILGVTRISTYREIKNKYNNLSLALHPDKNPNQTQEDKDLYVLVNKAWEILGNEKSRDEYDNYLKLKSKLDSPRESMILVFIILYALAVFVVYQYRKQRNYQIKLMLLKDNKVKRYFKDIGINITDTKQKIIKKKDKKSKRKSKNKDNNNSNNKDKIKSSSDITNEHIQMALDKLNLKAPGFTVDEPEWKDVAKTLPYDILWLINKIIYKIKFRIKYQILGQTMSDDDREYCCRKNFGINEEEWNLMTLQEKQKYLNKPGQWKLKKSQKKD